MKLCIIATGLAVVATWPGQCLAQHVDDPFSDYLQRSVTISMGAGNAKDANAAIHTITPWPPFVGDRRIAVDGRHAVDSVERMYRVPDPFGRQGAGTASGAAASSGGDISASAPAGTPVTPMQPISGGY